MKRSLLARTIRTICMVSLTTNALAPQLSMAAEDEPVKLQDLSVEGDRLDVLPTEPVESVFGFSKNALETPRSVTSISNEMMDKVIITEIDDLVAMTPGSFTQSFFGGAGSLDVRGTPGETYFRGVRRIDNPGNYPTPIGASDRIDVVRGPASPIFGPSKIGGYLNFVPKSARARTGQYLPEPKGEIGLTSGSWDKKILRAEVGGPSEMFGKPMGYYLYGEFENSGGYYNSTSTDQSIYQASFDLNITDKLRAEFGGMYQDFKGNQVAGWNRLTQELIDHGTYVTGSPPSLDTNGDGLLSDTESAAGNIAQFVFNPASISAEDIAEFQATHPNMALINPGTTHIDGNTVLVQDDDTLEDEVVTLYYDLIYTPSDKFKLTNKIFYESLDNINENIYGFSQFADTWVVEDQFIAAYSTDIGESILASFQLSPSIRHQNFEHGDNFAFEYFDRRDITQAGSPIDRRTMATRGQEIYSSHTNGEYTDYGLAFMADLTFFRKLNLLGGVRYDYIDMEAKGIEDAIDNAGLEASDSEDAVSWSGSVSYELPFGIRPYATFAKQTTLIVGQGGQIDPGNIESGNAVADSELEEYGIKAGLLGGRLYVAVDYYEQKRVDFNAQDTVTNNTTEAKGYEFEARYVVTPEITLTAAYTNIKVYNLTAIDNGTQFSFAGADDLPGVDPSLIYGGVVPSIVLLPVANPEGRKAGIPEDIVSLYAIFSFEKWAPGLTSSIGATSVSSVYSGFSQSVKLPSYTLLNAGVHYETANWKVSLQGKNLSDERYFRSNFPDLFGSSVVLPELPRNFLVSATYKF